MNHLIRDLAYCERPYEKALERGVEALTDAELLAVILRTGTKEASSIDLANSILNCHPTKKGLSSLLYVTRKDLLQVKGIGNTKATELLAVKELASRISSISLKKDICFNNPDTIARYYMRKCKFLSQEYSFLMLFSNSNHLISEIEISKGTVNASLLSTREIFIEALKYEAVNLILVHNHPSGNPEPSRADIELTQKIKEGAALLDLKLIDHIVIGQDQYVSFLERGLLP